MSYSKPITGAIAKAYYVEEATYGTTPANPSFQWIGVVQNVEPNMDRSLIKLRGIGSRDLSYIIKGLLKAEVSMEYAYEDNIFLNFADYLNDFSMEVYTDNGTTVNSYLYVGGMINSVDVNCSVNNLITVKPNIIAKNVTIGTAHPSGATYASDSGFAPKTWYDTKVEIPSGTEIDGVTDWSFKINNNLERYPVVTSTSGDLLKYLVERHREYTGELTVAYMSNTLLSAMKDSSEMATLNINISGHNYMFNKVKFDTGRLTARPVEVIPQKLSWTAKTLTII
jgi:hypothetical protein